MTRLRGAVVFVNCFIVGCILMGFEMLGSRYLYPYFGGGIGTWAGLISMVLCALAIGYLVGGAVVDRYPTLWVVVISIALAGAWLACIPATADDAMRAILGSAGEGPTGILIASAALLLVPVSFLGTVSPVAVRLLIQSTGQTGRISGLVYGVSTIGNVCGTLVTTFALIPTIGSRAITYLFAAILAASAVSLAVAGGRR
ncbi:MAG TPA: fused MFS/spermidine synthase [Stellaceae bacterium]|nr:fused MFS/spermidine synthase [Stellaceae bacterium]